MPLSPDTPLTPALVHRLWQSGALPEGRHAEALDMARDDAAWARWGRRLLLAAAVGQMLAAVVFFFAWNWADLPGLAKIALTLGLTVGLALASCLRLRATVGQALLFASGLMVGVTLAVFGQHFQTGADAWQLFALWAVLLAPWAATRANAALWALWLVVAEVGLVFFLDTLEHADAVPDIALAALPAVALLAHDAAPRLVPRWLGLLGLAAVLGVAGALTVQAVSFAEAGEPWRWAAPLVLAGAVAQAVLRLWRGRDDLGALTLAVGALCTVAAAILLIEIDGWFIGSLLTAGLFAGAAQFLNRQRARP